MHRFWNLKTQFIVVFVALLLGALLLQNYVHELNKDRLLVKVERTAQRIANEVTQQLSESVSQEFPVSIHGYEPGLSVRTRRVNVKGQARVRLEIQNRLVEVMHRAIENAHEQETRRLREQLLLVIETLQPENPNGGPFLLEVVPRPEHAAAEFDETLLFREEDHLTRGKTPDPTAADGEAAIAALREGSHQDGSVTRFAPLAVPGSDNSAGSLRGRLPVGISAIDDIDITDHLSDVQSLFDEYRRIDLLATVGIFLCGIAAALYLSFRITSPLYSVVDAFERVSEGDLETRVDGKNPGEFSVLAEQFNRMVESLAENRELERELAQRERVLHMGDLAAGVAHDVRNPLNAIHLNIGQIRDEFVPEDDESRERFLRFTSDVRREVERLNKLVSNFLSLAQPSGGTAESIDPNRVLRELERLLGKEAAARHVALSVDLAEELPTLVWDRQELMSAFLNIAMNALQSMEPDGGSLEVASTLRANDEGREAVVLTFTDTGPGIAPDDLERVFVPYFTTRHGGTGLGLAIARRITERNGGRLELVSEVGTGTSVAFVFPLDRQPANNATIVTDGPVGGGELA